MPPMVVEDPGRRRDPLPDRRRNEVVHRKPMAAAANS
jgi:hypothetical protein